MQIKKRYLPLLFCLFALSCEKTIDFSGEEQIPMVVITSEPEPDTPLAVRATYSRFFLSGAQFKPVTGATVSIVAGGSTYNATFDGTHYVAPYSVQQGDSLRLTLTIPQSDTVVTAATRVPFRPQASVIESSQGNLRFALADRGGERNYYRISLQLIDTIINGYDSTGAYVEPTSDSALRYDTIVDVSNLWFSCSDATLTSEATSISMSIDDDEMYNSLFFTDELFDGQTRNITIKTNNYEIEEYEKKGYNTGGSHYVVTIEALSREAYLYELSLDKQSEEDFFLTEPVQIQCNISGGLGIFGAKASTKLLFDTDL